MLQRWPTRRCLLDDAPSLSTTRGAIADFLSSQDASVGGEPLVGAQRPDTFTFHFGQGRGARWTDTDRTCQWLLCFSDVHDAGYAKALALQSRDQLYPETDPDWEANGVGTFLPWGVYQDEDNYEWARIIYGALCTFEINRTKLDAGEPVDHSGGPLRIELQRDADDPDIWTLTIRRCFGYVPPKSNRARYLSQLEIQDLVTHIVADPATEIVYDNPPHPTEAHLFVLAHFLDGPATPDDWLKRIADNVTSRDSHLPLLLDEYKDGKRVETTPPAP